MRSTPAGSCSTSAHRMLGFQRSVQRLPSSKRQERKEASPAGACGQWAKGHMTARQKVRMTENWSPTIPGPQRTRTRTSVPHARCIPGRRPCRLRQPWRRGGAVNARALPSHSTRRARRIPLSALTTARGLEPSSSSTTGSATPWIQGHMHCLPRARPIRPKIRSGARPGLH